MTFHVKYIRGKDYIPITLILHWIASQIQVWYDCDITSFKTKIINNQTKKHEVLKSLMLLIVYCSNISKIKYNIIIYQNL